MLNRAKHRIIARNLVTIGACSLLTALIPSVAAEIVLSDPALSIEISSADGSAVLDVPSSDLVWDAGSERLYWNPGRAISFAEGAVTLAVLESVQFEIERCGKIGLNLTLRAGVREVVVAARSGLLEFPVVAADQAQARASASFTLRDLDSDGSYVYGLPANGTGIYRAYYNGDPGNGRRFAHLVALISAGSGGTASASQSSPTVGYSLVGREVGSLAIELVFALSDHDRLSASTYFDLLPDPAICGQDSDGDGWPDWLDGCPENPDLIQPGDNGCEADDGGGDILDPNDGSQPGSQPSDSNPSNEPTPAGGSSPSGDKLSGSSPGIPGANHAGSGTVGDGGDAVLLEQVDQLVGGIAAPCGMGAAGLLPVMMLGLCGLKLGGRNRGRL